MWYDDEAGIQGCFSGIVTRICHLDEAACSLVFEEYIAFLRL